MSLATIHQKSVPVSIRRRGVSYHSQRRVSIIEGCSDYLSTEVIRSELYSVELGLKIVDGENFSASGGSYKKGLNRSILDTSSGGFFAKLEYKAEEAGIKYTKVPTRKVKTSQTCACCGNQEKKNLSERIHNCKKCCFR